MYGKLTALRKSNLICCDDTASSYILQNPNQNLKTEDSLYVSKIKEIQFVVNNSAAYIKIIFCGQSFNVWF